MKIYSATETNFNNNGYGILRDVIECYSTEFLNGQYDIKFIYPVNGYLSEYLVENNIVKVDNGRDEEQLFRIKIIHGNVNQNSKEITVIANHITFDLEDNFLIDVRPENQNGAGALDHILSNTQYEHNFTSNSDIEEINTAYYIRKNVISALISEENNFCEKWNAELLRNNFEIYAKHNIGTDRGIKIQYGRNFKGLTWNVERDYVTRIMPQGSNELILPEKFIDSPLIANYPHPVIKKINFNEVGIIENEVTEEDAYNQLRNKVRDLYDKGIDKPTVSLELDMIDLSKTSEYSKYSAFEIIKLGDTVTANIPQFNLDTKMKVTGLEYDCLRKKNSLVYLSNKGQTPTNSITDLSKNINSITSNLNELNNLPPKTTLELAKESASNYIKNAMGGFATKTESEYLVLDTGDVNTAQKVGRWNINGLGFSKDGFNGLYETTITANGEVNADKITFGTLEGSLIKAGSLKTESLSIEVIDKIQSSGNNLLVGTALFNLDPFGFNGTRNYVEGDNPPDTPNLNDFWYCTLTHDNFESGIMYQYDGTTWKVANYTKKQLDQMGKTLSNTEIIENEDTKNNFETDKALQITAPNVQGIGSSGGFTTSMFNLNKNEDKITFSSRIQNNLDYGDLMITIYQFKDDFSVNGYNLSLFLNSFLGAKDITYTPDERRNLDLLTIQNKINKIENLLIVESGEMPPEDITKKWLMPIDEDVFVLMSFDEDIEDWDIYNYDGNLKDQNNVIYQYLSSTNNPFTVYFPTDFINNNAMCGYVRIYAQVSYITEVSEEEPIPYWNCYWAKESTDEIRRASFDENGNFKEWILLPVSFTQAIINGAEVDDAPFIYPSGNIIVGDLKVEYGEYTKWTPNANELVGANHYFGKNGWEIVKGDYKRIIDEDENISKNMRTGEIVYYQDRDMTYSKISKSKQIELDEKVESSINIGGNKVFIEYIR